MENRVFDAVVIGGGVVGVSVFNELISNGYTCAIIEKELDVSVGTTKANSGLIHAGFDAEPNTLKAKFNVEGNKFFPSICERLHVDLKKCGAYVVGDNEKVIDELIARGKKNGVTGLHKLNRDKLKKEVPSIADNITCALKADNAYIIDPYFYTICLAEEGVLNGGEIYFNFELNRVTKSGGVFALSNGIDTVYARNIINSTGTKYNEVADILGAEKYDIEYRRGEYYVLDHSEKDIVPSTIFPMPSKAGKGVLVTPTVSGNILVGPTSYVSDDKTITTSAGLKDIATKVSNMLTNVNLSKTIRIFSGVRSIIGHDFVVEKSKLQDGVINIAGICSPGLSSAPAIAKYVFNLLGLKPKNVKLQSITPYTKLGQLSLAEKNKLIAKNSDYGKIVCKCEGISLGEIKDAINRPIRPMTMDGIKRRVRAGMGRCQGGFCNDKVAKILAKENNIFLDQVCKEKVGSNYIVGNITSKGETK